MNPMSIFSAVRPSLGMSFDASERPDAHLSPRFKNMSKLAATRKFWPIKKKFFFFDAAFLYSKDPETELRNLLSWARTFDTRLAEGSGVSTDGGVGPGSGVEAVRQTLNNVMLEKHWVGPSVGSRNI